MMNLLKTYREKAGLSQAELSMKAGFGSGQGRISNYECGNRRPSLDDARKIVAALRKSGVRCTLDDVFPIEPAAQLEKTA